MPTLIVRIDEARHTRWKQTAQDADLTLSALVRALLDRASIQRIDTGLKRCPDCGWTMPLGPRQSMWWCPCGWRYERP